MAESALQPLLARLRPIGALSDSSFEEQIKLCAGVAAGRKAHTEAQQAAIQAGLSVDTQRALVALFMETSRINIGREELIASLSTVMPAERANALASITQEGQAAFCGTLDALSFRPDEVVDVTWARSSVAAAGHEQPRSGGTPMYSVTLTMRSPDGSTRPLQFTADTEELHDLVASLKSAVRQVEHQLSSQ